jgi:energy-coupling factor transporter ATP-binding protein EcfA2
LGQTLQQFADTADAGRDGAFHGTWARRGQETMSGSFVLQCKFTAQNNSLLQVSDVSEELEKAARLARKGLCRNYLLITNASLRAPVEATLKERFESIRGIHHFAAFDGNWLTQQILEHQRLRILVPRIYGLGDLTEILDERVYQQAQEVLSWLGDELSRFVITDAHHRSVKALQDKRFVFLLGDAGSGKSTIAAALALAAADKWQSRVIKVNRPSDFQNHSNPNERNQFFWVDDAFGQLRYERERATHWNQLLPNLAAAIRRGAIAIFTSRRYIYKDAIEDLKDSTFPLLKESQVVIEVEKLTEREREQILYNHLRLGSQPQGYRSSLKPFLPNVAQSKFFQPELARRLGIHSYTKKVGTNEESVMHFLEHADDYLYEQFQTFGDSNRAAMALVFMKNGLLRAPLSELSHEDEQALKLFNSNIGEVRRALKSLDGPYIARQIHNGETLYRFKHPTIRDGYGKFIASDPNLMDCYLKGTSTTMLLEEVTCGGDANEEGGGLVIPPRRYSVVIERLRGLLGEPGGNERVVIFLNSKCAADFLAAFTNEIPWFADSLSLKYSNIEWSPITRLYLKLHQHGLLPESCRQRFVKVTGNAALNRHKWSLVQHPHFRSLFRSSEIRKLRSQVVRKITKSALDEAINDWKESWESEKDESPGDYFWSLSREFESLLDEFGANRRASDRLRDALDQIQEVVKELDSDYMPREDTLEAELFEDSDTAGRSVFDDVDALA